MPSFECLDDGRADVRVGADGELHAASLCGGVGVAPAENGERFGGVRNQGDRNVRDEGNTRLTSPQSHRVVN